MHITRVLAISAVGALGALTVAIAPSTSGADDGAGATHAEATIIDTAGAAVGFASLTEDGAGRVHVNVKVSGLAPGLHGIHIHGVGACAPDFNAAGGHHNPLGQAHGQHAGDLPNLTVNAEGRGRLNATVASFTLSAGPTSAFDANGSAIVVHALPDDFVTQPTGGSGGRIACGVLVPR